MNSMIEKNENETSEFNDRKKMRMRLLIEENRNENTVFLADEEQKCRTGELYDKLHNTSTIYVI